MSTLRRRLLVVCVAVLGIAVAAAVTWGTSQLVRQRIGLASEPLNAGLRLLPPAAATRTTTTSSPRSSSTRTTPTRTRHLSRPSSTVQPAPAPSEPQPAPAPSEPQPVPTPSEPTEPSRSGGGESSPSSGDTRTHRDD
jgi:hypothetical protein